MLDSKQRGVFTELQCISAFCELGHKISIPYGENSRYDFIADVGGNLLRIQCKSSHEVDDGVIKFSCRSTRVNSSGNISRRYTSNEIDYFCTYYDNKCYLIPISECSIEKKLRFNPPKNNQKVGVTYADEYELKTQLEKIQGRTLVN